MISQYLSRLRAIGEKATEGPWWSNGCDVESSHLTVGEGEEMKELYDLKNDYNKVSKRIKIHATEGPFTKKAQSLTEEDVLIFSTGTILGDRDAKEAIETAEFIATARNEWDRLLRMNEVLVEALAGVAQGHTITKFGGYDSNGNVIAEESLLVTKETERARAALQRAEEMVKE